MVVAALPRVTGLAKEEPPERLSFTPVPSSARLPPEPRAVLLAISISPAFTVSFPLKSSEFPLKVSFPSPFLILLC